VVATVLNLAVLDRSPFAREFDLVSELFHRINRVLPIDQAPLKVQPDCRARDAIALMAEHRYSQVPVVSGDKVLGVFSYRSFAEDVARTTLDELNQQKCAPGDLAVIEYLEQFEFARVTDEMSKVFEAIDRDDGVLVGDPEKLLGVLTPMDFLRYLHRVANPFVVLSEIELALRALIRIALHPDDLAAVAKRALESIYQGRMDELPLVLEEMTFEDYRSLLDFGETWNHFEPFFGTARKRVSGKLKEVRVIRNDVFHFRREITAADQKTLTTHRSWLLAMVQRAQAHDKRREPS
jgi:predicted transcriptional regulator